MTRLNGTVRRVIKFEGNVPLPANQREMVFVLDARQKSLRMRVLRGRTEYALPLLTIFNLAVRAAVASEIRTKKNRTKKIQ